MISSISRKIAETLGRKQEADRDQISVYAYALEILLGTMIKLTLIIALATLLGVLKTALVFLLTFSLFRRVGGGVHLSTYLKCLVVGLFLVLVMGYAATLHIDRLYVVGLYLCSLSIAIYAIIQWVPAGTDKKQVTDIHKRLKQKKETLVALIIWSLFVFICIFCNLYSYVMAAVLGSLCSSFFMTPIGYIFIETLDDLLLAAGKGGEESV